MTSRRCAAAVALMALLVLGAGCGDKANKQAIPASSLGVNLVKNPSFELWRGAVPDGWTIEHFEGSGEKRNYYGKSIEEKKTGQFAFYLRGVYTVDRWLVLVQRHPVAPGYRLWFAAEMRGKDLQKNRGQEDRANVYVRFYDKNGKRVNERYYADGYTRTLRGTSDWQRLGRRVEVPKNARYVDIGLICEMTGWIYFDDVELVLEAPIPWKEIKTKYVNYYYLEGSPFPAGAIDKETAFVEDCVKKLDLKVENKVSYYYYPSEAKFQEIMDVRKGHERAMWKKQELHTTKTYDDHEMIHMLLEPAGYPPFGLVEGLIFYVLGSWEGRDLHLVAKQSLIGMKLPAFYKLLQQQEMDAAGMSNVVPGWASFTIWLIDRQGLGKFMKLYKATNEVTDATTFATRFKEIYGKDFEETDREWRLWVLRYQPRK